MTNEQIKAFALEHHAEMQEKGFWKNKDLNTKIALIIGEVYECLEAHHKGEICRTQIAKFVDANFEQALIVGMFEKSVKDTVPDEAADAMLRLLDLMAFLNMFDFPIDTQGLKITTDNFSKRILALNEILLNSVENRKNLYLAFSFIETMDIFDWHHVIAKRKYNATRPFMFGKKY